jgi:hypothetical protein
VGLVGGEEDLNQEMVQMAIHSVLLPQVPGTISARTIVIFSFPSVPCPVEFYVCVQCA